MSDNIAISCLLAAVALVYATVGQAGGTAFLAVMAVVGVPAEELRPTALALNIVAASYTTWRLHRAGAINWRLLGSVGAASLPMALLGGLIVLDATPYYMLTGSVLLATAGLMISTPIPTAQRHMGAAARVISGAVIGLLSGLTGVGGGVFLAPLLILGGWATARDAAAVSAPFILGNSILGLSGAIAGGQGVSPDFALYAGATVLGAAIGVGIGKIMAERSIRFVMAFVLAAAGLRLLIGSISS